MRDRRATHRALPRASARDVCVGQRIWTCGSWRSVMWPCWEGWQHNGRTHPPVEEPTNALPLSDNAALTAEQVESWRERGFTLVHGLFPAELIDEARDEMRRSPPGRLGAGLMFPSGSHTLNRISTHPRLRAAAQQLLGTGRLQLLQSEAWTKSPPTTTSTLLGMLPGGAYSNSDQRIHMDYPNHCRR